MSDFLKLSRNHKYTTTKFKVQYLGCYITQYVNVGLWVKAELSC